MTKILGIEYARGATAKIIDDGPALAPAVVRKMFPNAEWTIIPSHPATHAECLADRFGDCYKIQQKIYNATPAARHILIGGDHSVNFGHFAALADRMPDEDLCLIYIDAHLDIHSPASSQREASGAPHGTNVRANLGTGDARWLSLSRRMPALKPENLFYLGTRSYEPSEINFAHDKNIMMFAPDALQTASDIDAAIATVRRRINGRPFVVSFDFDAIDPKYFPDVLVPAADGLTPEVARRLVREFAADAHSFEFVEYAPSGNAQCASIARELIRIVIDAQKD